MTRTKVTVCDSRGKYHSFQNEQYDVDYDQDGSAFNVFYYTKETRRVQLGTFINPVSIKKTRLDETDNSYQKSTNESIDPFTQKDVENKGNVEPDFDVLDPNKTSIEDVMKDDTVDQTPEKEDEYIPQKSFDELKDQFNTALDQVKKNAEDNKISEKAKGDDLPDSETDDDYTESPEVKEKIEAAVKQHKETLKSSENKE